MTTTRSIYFPWLGLCLLLWALCITTAFADANDEDPPRRFRGSGRKDKLLVILLDGFRWDYATKHQMTSFAKIRKTGVHAEYMYPVFPSMSFPNYYSLATGLYVESHGMVMNYIYDPEHKQTFRMLVHPNSTQPFWWEEAEPVWITATKRAKRTFLYLWPGGEVTIHNVKPSFSEPYVSHSGLNMFRQHLDDALQRFKANEADLVQVYCEYTDILGHQYGPESKELKEGLKLLDFELNTLLEKITKLELNNKVNVVIVSDHGMTDTSPKKVTRLSLDSLIRMVDVELLLGHGAVVGVFPKIGYKEKVYSELGKSKDIHVWKKEELPEDYHMQNNMRTPPIVVIAKSGVFITPVREQELQIPYTSRSETKEYYGFHGYDVDEVPDMRGIFYAFGPGFEKGEKHQPITIVDVYNVLMHLLDLEPLPNNGSWTMVYKMIRSENGASALSENVFITLTCIGGIFMYSLMALFNNLWV
ncbi:Ectonucleotide pyrophosphatase/phosphodiesterase member 6 [Chamberlinius hualienensis]